MTAATSFANYRPAPDHRTTAELVATGEIESSDDWNTYPSPGLPMANARRLMADIFSTGGKQTLAYWRGAWWLWGGASWEQAEDDLDVKERIWDRLEQATCKTKDGDPIPWAPTTAKVGNLMEPLAIRARIPGRVDAPAWLDGGKHPPASRIIPMNNGLVDLETGRITGHDPALFTTWHLPFDYDPNATCPTWARFLGDVFAHDPAGELLLQEYAGYLISGRTDLHKALLIVGPRRGGKGTISRTVQRLVGTGNTVSPTLGSLGSEFGLADLIGKPLAVVEDARADDDRRNNTTVERLLNIIGEDAVSINRKNRDYWNGTLPTRFMIVSNETPRFLDSSGAITSRFMSVRLKQSYEHNPDPTLGARIAGELPGIFNWAVEGLHRLDKQGHFTRPATMDEMHDLMADMTSPIARFIEERYTVTGNDADTLKVSDVFTAFKQWAEDQSMRPINRDTFIQRVLSAAPEVSYKNTRIDGRMGRHFFGVKEQPWEFSK